MKLSHACRNQAGVPPVDKLCRPCCVGSMGTKDISCFECLGQVCKLVLRFHCDAVSLTLILGLFPSSSVNVWM